MSTKNHLNKTKSDDLKQENLIKDKEVNELKKIIDHKDKAIEELTNKINSQLTDLRKNGL
jgi:hypothetical protein